MPSAVIDGLELNYIVKGDGPPLLMFAPGAFDATIEKWSTAGVWKLMQPLDELARDFRLIAYDRRESSAAGGHVEPLSWKLFAAQGKHLLDHLGIAQAYVLGGCMGCAVATAFAVQFPETCLGAILHWPVGGHRWRKMGRKLFDQHLAFLNAEGFSGVVASARKTGSFWQNPDAGPWASAIARSNEFAEAFVQQPLNRYIGIVCVSRDALFADSHPSGVTEEELLGITIPTLIISGSDEAHTRSAAWTIHELISGAQIAPSFPPDQTPEKVAQWIRNFVAQQHKG